jgi:hypothetical protein
MRGARPELRVVGEDEGMPEPSPIAHDQPKPPPELSAEMAETWQPSCPIFRSDGFGRPA